MAESAMAGPMFSFLTTAYRTERYVGQTIESVLAQTRSDWELIVVDNGNSDAMAGAVERYTDDPRITLIRQDNSGVRGGVTTAAGAAIGRYLCLLDSDDLLQPDFCERVGAMINAHPGLDAVGCDVEMFRDGDEWPPEAYFHTIGRRSRPDPSRSMSLEEMLQEGVPPYIGAIRRQTWTDHTPYDPGGHDVEPDVEMWLSLAAEGRDIRLLPSRLARVRVRGDSMTHEPSAVESFEDRLERAFLSVAQRHPHKSAAVSASAMVRRLRYQQALRRARWAMLDGDVAQARAAAKDAFAHRHTARAVAVIVALSTAPGLVRSLHPAKNRAQRLLRAARFRLERGRVR